MHTPLLKHFRNLLWLAITLLVLACATIRPEQTTCKQYNNLTQTAACFEQNLNPNSDATKQYIAYANKLIAQVENKKLSEADAKNLLSKSYRELKKITDDSSLFPVNHIAPSNPDETAPEKPPGV